MKVTFLRGKTAVGCAGLLQCVRTKIAARREPSGYRSRELVGTVLGSCWDTPTRPKQLLERNAKGRERSVGLFPHENEKFCRCVTV
jgi:hypothetical protein